MTGSPEVTHAETVKVWKSPTCGCCAAWVDHLRENGFAVEVENTAQMGQIKRSLGVPENIGSCHTARVGGYTVEGHVPADEIARLLTEKPAVHGLSVPGMPIGSPGMEVPGARPYQVLSFTGGRTDVWSVEDPR
nr:DUF411 domain-containing protein [Rhodovibrio sodomensis]